MKPLPYILLLALCGCMATKPVATLDPRTASKAFVKSETVQGSSTFVVIKPFVNVFSVPSDSTNRIWAYQVSNDLVHWAYSELREAGIPVYHYEEIPTLPAQVGDVCFYRVEWSEW